MKRLRLGIILVIMLIVLSGCSQENEQINFNILNNTDDKNAESETESNTEYESNYAQDLLDGYKSIEAEQDFSFQSSKFLIYNEDTESNMFCEFYIQTVLADLDSGTVRFYKSEDESISESFDITFDLDFNSDSLKDFLTATIMLLDDTKDVSDANKLMKKIVNSTASNSISDTIEINSYKICLVNMDTSIASKYVIKVISKNTQNTFDPSKYENLDYEAMLSPLNEGEYVQIEATVQDVDSNTFPRELSVVDCNNDRYIIYAMMDTFPYNFSIDEKIHFYGVLAKTRVNTVCIRIEYFE